VSFSRREFRNREAETGFHRAHRPWGSFSRREFRNREAEKKPCHFNLGNLQLQSARIQES